MLGQTLLLTGWTTNMTYNFKKGDLLEIKIGTTGSPHKYVVTKWKDSDPNFTVIGLETFKTKNTDMQFYEVSLNKDTGIGLHKVGHIDIDKYLTEPLYQVNLKVQELAFRRKEKGYAF